MYDKIVELYFEEALKKLTEKERPSRRQMIYVDGVLIAAVDFKDDKAETKEVHF